MEPARFIIFGTASIARPGIAQPLLREPRRNARRSQWFAWLPGTPYNDRLAQGLARGLIGGDPPPTSNKRRALIPTGECHMKSISRTGVIVGVALLAGLYLPAAAQQTASP